MFWLTATSPSRERPDERSSVSERPSLAVLRTGLAGP